MSTKPLKFFILLIVSLAFIEGVWAQNHQYKFTTLAEKEGLSHNRVNTFFRDSNGYLWIGTFSGLNRFDSHSVRSFKNNPRDPSSIGENLVYQIAEDPHGRIWVNGDQAYVPQKDAFYTDTDSLLSQYHIPGGSIRDIKKDSEGHYWFLHDQLGLFEYNPGSQKTVHHQHQQEDPYTPSQGVITSLVADWKGNLWIIFQNGLLEKLDARTKKVVLRNDFLVQKHKKVLWDYSLTLDADGDLWLYPENNANGLFYYNSAANSFEHYHQNSTPLKLNTNIVRGIVQDNQGLIWVGTDHGGINLINKRNKTISYLLNDLEDKQSLSQNSITKLYKDHQGIIWIGTYKKGVCYYHENMIHFPVYKHFPSNAHSLPYDDVNRFVEDKKGNLWIGTNGGGLIYFDREKGTYKSYLHQANNPNSISSNVIVSMLIDHQDKLWVGTYFGGLNCFDGTRFIRYLPDAGNPSSISSDNVWELFEDSDKRLWIGTLGGLDLFDRTTQKFQHFLDSTHNPQSIPDNYISAIEEDHDKNIWVGTSTGVYVLEKQSGKVIQYKFDKNNPNSLSDNDILSIKEDARGLIWIGTQEGLNLFDKNTKTFRVFREEDGLPNNTALMILEDNSHNLWISTPNGLSCLSISQDENEYYFRFKNYDEEDGLQSRQFNENSALKTRSGELIFGGAQGFNIFRPENIGLNQYKPKVVITDFQVLNKSIKIGEVIGGREIEESIHTSKAISLKHKENVFSIEFAAINYIHPEKTVYKYMLEGFNKDWISANDKSSKVTYTNLDPGQYVFKVKAANNDGFWSDEAAELHITVLTPFWRTSYAFVLYTLLFLVSLLLARRIILQRERMKFQLVQERQEAHRMHELDMMKIKFFTNVSHEFRTPLTLILTPLEKLMNQTKDESQKGQFQLIHRNARRLLSLVNQLLDFRRMEVQEVKMSSSEGDIIKFLEDTVHSFSDLSEKKNISLAFHSSISSLETIFDQDKLEKIIFNLLSNAFKFTPEHGKVEVDVQGILQGDAHWLQIKVSDTGIGIAADKQERIFERFFQDDLPSKIVNQGSGIGLSIVKEFVKAHGGNVSVESVPNQGTTFTVLIPIQDIGEASSADQESEDDLQRMESGGGDKPILLLVEDNEDFRFYLKDNLKQQYQIIEASNGKQGLKLTLSQLPDLIVSDVMMPEMNGIDFCRHIKDNKDTSHIPVILLTARSAEEQKLEGYEVGANDYITKPFNFEILQSRIKNLLYQRSLAHKDFRKQIEVKASEMKITSLDEKLIQSAIKLVEEHLSEAEFSVEDMSHELGMSRVHLYKKLMALTGKSPIEFIRVIRLQRAAQLLEKSQLTVSEVAYQVGFNNPKYFTKYFKDEYNVLPSNYAKRNEA